MSSPVFVRKNALRKFLTDLVNSVDPSWFPKVDDTGYYNWTKHKWLDLLHRAVDLLVNIPNPDSLPTACWLASARQISAGSSSCKPILYNCAFVIRNPHHRDTLRSRQEESNSRKRKSDAPHVSHLCGNNACWNPNHLVLESPVQNEARKSKSEIKRILLVDLVCCPSLTWIFEEDCVS